MTTYKNTLTGDKMKPIFNINKDYDICTLPYSPISENDKLEIRLQVFNSGESGIVNVKFFFYSF